MAGTKRFTYLAGMARGQRRWWQEPPRWSWAVTVISLVFIVVGAPLTVGRGEIPASDVARMNAEAESRHSAASAAREAAEDRLLRVAFLGDSYVSGSREDSGTASQWPALLTSDREWVTNVIGRGGAGYVSTNEFGRGRFDEQVQSAVLFGAELVIIVGSRHDAYTEASEVELAARETLATLRRELPDATIIVVGPIWAGPPPVEVRRAAEAIHDAAVGAGVHVWIDPIAEGWFLDLDDGLVGEDEAHPTDAGHRWLGVRMLDALRAAGITV